MFYIPKQHNYNPLSLSSRLKVYIEKVENDYRRTRFYKKHWHLVEFIEDLEIFSIYRFFQVAKECGAKTSRRTCSTYLFYLYMDNFLEFTPVTTLMGSVAQIYNIDTIDPEKKLKAIKYYESINPRNQVKHDHKKNKQIQTFISSYESGNIQSAAYKKGRNDRATDAAAIATKLDDPKIKEAQKYREKTGPAETKARAQRKKKQKAKTSKN